ncbi:MAG TPA: fumarylacetoacetase [Gemmatimonadaceae bacterium]|nr:fumarylacetoacetase [Gemmatimonadaceae bacterium]
MIDETHDPALISWIDSANDPATDFPPQNLPLGVFSRGEGTRIGIAIGEEILDIDACVRAGMFESLDTLVRRALRTHTLNELMAFGREGVSKVRRQVSRLVRADSAEGARAKRLRDEILVPRSECGLGMPVSVGDYTDFYASIHHATNVGALFRPDNPLLPNYKWVPIAYHGRASSIIRDGSPVVRPHGQSRKEGDAAPSFGPSRALDYELEVGVYICGANDGGGNLQGERVHLSHAEDYMFGVCLVNDWSARDIQSWEYQPLGPFLAKNFATSVSPWVVTMDACAPFRSPPAARASGDPPLLAYLDDPQDRAQGAIDATLEVWLRTARMRTADAPATRLSRGAFRDMYWTLAQMVAHHTSNGCNLRTGDLIASGTVSGPAAESRGCLLEMTRKGAEPFSLPNGETRTYLEDGDEVILRGWCEREGFRRIGFGECSGRIV